MIYVAVALYSIEISAYISLDNGVTLSFRMSASFFLSFYISSSVGFHNRLVLFPSLPHFLFGIF